MKSYFHQPGTFPYVYETIPERVKKLADESPDKVAMVVYHSKEERHQITRKELYDKSLVFARVLVNLGINKGDRIAYCVSNCVDWMVYDVGIMMAGAVAVHLLMGSADVNVTLTDCVMIILDSKERWNNFLAVAEIQQAGQVICKECPSLKLAMAVQEQHRPANALLASELMAKIVKQENPMLPVLNSDDLALINQTSGSTGYPKKVRQSHFNVVNNFSTYCQISNITGDDVCYFNRPMAYIGGYPIVYVGAGATIITGEVKFLSDPANYEFVVDVWRKNHCNVVCILPQCIKYLNDYGFRAKLIITGGDMITEEMIKHTFVFADTFSVVYGSTETNLTIQQLYSKEDSSTHKQGMLGTPFPGVEVKIVNNKGDVVEMGETGTLCFRSNWNTLGYDGKLENPIQNGWFHSNDICFMEADGRILMKGRKSGFIIKGTVNVSIQLIEDYVGSHRDVEQVVVVGVPDCRFGEDICACVKLASGRTFDQADLKDYCEKKMSSKSSLDWISMVPSYFLNFDAFPKLLTEKFDRNRIKALAIQRLKEI